MPKVTEAHLEARRQQILEAAFACFSRQGFHQTSMQDICREAELSPGAVYRYFASKEEIIDACCEGCQQVDLSMLESATQNGGTFEVLDRIREEAFSGLDQPESNVVLRLNVQWWSEALRSPELRESLARNNAGMWRDTLGRIVARAQELGEVKPDLDPEAVGRVLLSMWLGFVLQKALDPEVDVESYVDAVGALYSGSFRQREGQTGDQQSEAGSLQTKGVPQ